MAREDRIRVPIQQRDVLIFDRKELEELVGMDTLWRLVAKLEARVAALEGEQEPRRTREG